MSLPTEAANALFVVGNVKLIFLTGHVRLAVPFALGKVYDLVETDPGTPGVAPGLALRDDRTTAHHGWVKTRARDPTDSMASVKRGLEMVGHLEATGRPVARLKITHVGNLFEAKDRDGVAQVGVHGDAICWITDAGHATSDAESEGR